jgi:hypothetical protein
MTELARLIAQVIIVALLTWIGLGIVMVAMLKANI